MELFRSLSMPVAQFDVPEAAAEWCARWLALRAASRPHGVRLAAVFDIDATLISTDARIELVCSLVDQCTELRITPFLITARSEDGREFTEQQLRSLRIGGYKRLFMHPPQTPVREAGRVKQNARERIASHGYTVCFNAGDALHDHYHPVPVEVRHAISGSAAMCVFVTPDGMAHLKPPS